jgi:hypothetical protein
LHNRPFADSCQARLVNFKLLAVFLGVMFSGFFRMVRGMKVVAMR